MKTLTTFARLIAIFEENQIDNDIFDVSKTDEFESRKELMSSSTNFVQVLMTEFPALFITSALDRVSQFAEAAVKEPLLRNRALDELVAIIPESKEEGSTAVIYGDKFTFKESKVYEIPKDALIDDIKAKIEAVNKEMEPFAVKLKGLEASLKAREDFLKSKIEPSETKETLAIAKK